MPAVGELIRFPSARGAVAPPLRCPRGHLMRRERVVVYSAACACGRHRTWRCHCGVVLAEACEATRAVPTFESVTIKGEGHDHR